MGHAHPHGHGQASAPGAGRAGRRRLVVVLGLSCAFLGVEVVAGFLTGSLALLADAGHMLTDVAGLGLALAAMKFAERPPSPRRTYGYHRVEILAAAANGVALLGIGCYILYEAWRRFASPRPIAAVEVLAVAAVGLLVNVAGALLLRAGSKASLNVRSAYNEVLADALSSLGVIAGALVMRASGWYWVDPLVAAAIALWVLPRTVSLLREALQVLLEGTPRDVDLAALRATMEGVPGVKKVHDLHVWTLTSGVHALSAHAVVAGGAAHDQVLVALRARVTEEYPISHLTVQLEERCCGEHAHA
jgi:cobalt-zinc-cadmium efflux system protein